MGREAHSWTYKNHNSTSQSFVWRNAFSKALEKSTAQENRDIFVSPLNQILDFLVMK